MPAVTESITLRHGVTLPLRVIAWLIDAEGRGLHANVRGDVLRVGPPEAISDADDALIRAHRADVIAAAAYLDRVLQEPLV